MNTRMPLAEGDPGWWGYAEKNAWAAFKREHAKNADAITRLVATVFFTKENCTDPVLTGGVQFEGLCLRVAELCGLVEVERQ